MYRAFELKVDNLNLPYSNFEEVILSGSNVLNESKQDINTILNRVTEHGIIDGTRLVDGIFPTIQRDVFLSYSHNDAKLIQIIAGILFSELNLTVFVDSMFWKSADELLKEIDKNYCKSDHSNHTYDYRKRNLSTSHVHAMLTSSIIKAMDEAEIIIFVNTPNSVPDLGIAIDRNGYDEYTLSPWIYEELLLTNVIRQRDWTEYRKRTLTESGDQLYHFDEQLIVKYKLPMENLIKLTVDDINSWVAEYKNNIEAGQNRGRYGGLFSGKKTYEVKHPLNMLYSIIERRSLV